MARRYSAAATALALFTACSSHSTQDTSQPSGDPTSGGDLGSGASDQPGAGSDPGSGAGPGSGGGVGSGSDGGVGSGGDSGATATCPLGAPTYAVRLDAETAGVLAGAGGSLFAFTAEGKFKLSPSGELTPLDLKFGRAFATDRAGNLYVADSFTEPVDVGLGVMQPEGNIDVFVAKFDPDGHLVFARPLHLCGDGVFALAVDATGRIAVSGTALGTAVLSAEGELQFTLSVVGSLAFDTRGDLVVATRELGASDRNDFAVLAFDPAGRPLWQQRFSGLGAALNGIAIDSHDHVVIAGSTTSTVDLFGDTFLAQLAPEAGRVTGAYLFKLDATGQLVWKRGDLNFSELHGIAIDPDDRIVIAGASTVNTGRFRSPVVEVLDPAGSLDTVRYVGSPTGASDDGEAVSVVADACGSVYAVYSSLDLPTPGSPVHAYVVKASRQ